MSATELLLLLVWGRGVGGADADCDCDCDWEIARAMNQSRPTLQCCLCGVGRADDERVATAGKAGLEEEALRGIDGDDDVDDVEGSGVASGPSWRVALL